MSKDGKTAKGANPTDMIYSLEGKPPVRIALPLGLQHVLTMFVGNLAPVLIIAGVICIGTGDSLISPEQKLLMVQCTMFISGVATLLQLYPIRIGKFQIGGGLPIVMGTSFVFVSALVGIGAQYGLAVIFGATLVGAFAEILLGIFLKQLRGLFPPVVIGSVLMAIGLSLLPIGVQYLAGGADAQRAAQGAEALVAAGQSVPADMALLASQYGSWQNLLIGAVVIVVIVIMQRWGKGFVKAMAILAGIVAGYTLSIAFGMVDFSSVTNSGIISIPRPFILPQFELGPVITIVLLYIVCGLETMGNVNGITAAAFNREATSNEISGSIIADGIGCIVASIFNALPNTAFGQNAGIVAMTKVVNKWVVAMGAFVLILAGFFPPVGAIFSVMPPCVLGGAVISVFGMIIVNGIKLIYFDGLSEQNIFTLCFTFGIGYAVSKTDMLVALLPGPLHFIFSETTLAVCLVAVIANLVFRSRANGGHHESKTTDGGIEGSKTSGGSTTNEVSEA